MTTSNKKNVLVEISGGVDSAVALHLLKSKGYNCIAATMILTQNHNKEDLQSANEICQKLNIPYYQINLIDEFKNNVINYFVDTYNNAQTPNPCVICNQTMKFGIMQEIAKKYNCEKIATGHYVQIVKNNDDLELHCAKDFTKDQSYFLHFLNQDLLSKLIFPLGKYTKKEVVKIAKSLNLSCANKKESQDICFIQDGNYNKFLEQNSKAKNSTGNIINSKGEILGMHQGLQNYTIGQRKGLGVALGSPHYVISLNNKTNEVILGTKNELEINNVELTSFNWINTKDIKEKFYCKAKLRYRQKANKCKVYVNKNSSHKVSLFFEEKISSVAPGQFAVLYDNNKVIGGGTIISNYHK